jgi:soluble lytic murein transglycosylase
MASPLNRLNRLNRRRRLSLLGAVLGLGLLAAVLGLGLLAADRGPAATLRAAAEKIRHGDYPAAISILAPITQSPAATARAAEARLMLCYSQYRLRNYAAAEAACLQSAAAAHRLQTYALYYAGNAGLAQGDYAEACAELARIFPLSPPASLLPRADYSLARCQVELGQAAAAVQTLDALARLPGAADQWAPDLLLFRAKALDRMGSPNLAGPLLRKLWVEFPASAAADEAEELLFAAGGERFNPAGGPLILDSDRLDRANYLIAAGAFSRALGELDPLLVQAEKAGVSSAQELTLRWPRAKALAGLRRSSAAVVEYQRILSLSQGQDVEAAYQLGRALDRLDRKAEALAAFALVWTRFPDREQARAALLRAGRLHQLDLEHPEAKQLFAQLISAYPGSDEADEARFQLGWMLYLDREYPEALLAFEGVRGRPEDPTASARALFWRSRTLDQLQRSAEAQPLRRQLLERFPGTGYAYLARHFSESSTPSWPLPPPDQKLEPEPQSPLDLSLFEKLVSLGLVPDSREEMDWWEARNPLLPAAALQISRAYLDQQDYYSSQRRILLSFADRLAGYQPQDRALWELAYPQAFPREVVAQAALYSLDPRLVWAIIRAESTYRPEIRSSAGAVGLMQIMPATGRKIARALRFRGYQTSRLEEPELNIRYGCYWVRQLLDRFHQGPAPAPSTGDLILALSAYNAGEHRVDEWRGRFARFNLGPDEFLEQIPFSETRNYVKRILGFYQIYSLLYPSV